MTNIGSPTSSSSCVARSFQVYSVKVCADAFVTPTYRTVPKPAVMVIAGIDPIALLAKERKTIFKGKGEGGFSWKKWWDWLLSYAAPKVLMLPEQDWEPTITWLGILKWGYWQPFSLVESGVEWWAATSFKPRKALPRQHCWGNAKECSGVQWVEPSWVLRLGFPCCKKWQGEPWINSSLLHLLSRR